MKILWYLFLAIAMMIVLIGLAQPIQAQSSCDPSYPDFCLAPPPPDLDCKDVSYRNFRVLPPDPHGFDGDLDGVGCEVH